MLTSFRAALSRFFAARSIATRIDPDTPFALYFHPSGKVQPLTLRSLKSGGDGGEYNALNAALSNRRGGAPANEQGYAWISEINVWVRRCVGIIADNTERLNFYVEDKLNKRRLEDHPLTGAMQRSRHFLQRSQRSLLIWGELYIKPLSNQYGYCSDLWWINNLSIQFNIVNGFIGQFYYTPLHGGKPAVWRPEEMCYIYTENPFDDLRGSSRILAVLQEANVHEEIARSAQAHFANDARPGIMFIPETDLGIQQSQEFIEYWKANFQGSLNTNRPVILPMQIKSVQTLDRAALKDDVDLRESIRREICAAFGVPLSVAGAWDDANYQSAPEQRKSFYEETLIPLAEQLAKDFTRSLLPFFDDRPGLRVWFDAKDLLALAEDKQQKTTALNSQLVSGGITVNEYRIATDQKSLPGGNVLYVPAGVIVTPVEKLGTLPPPAPPGGGFGFQSAPAAVSVDKPPPAALPETTEKAAVSLGMMLSLANDTGLIQLQNQLKGRAPDASIRWVDPSDFHVTLVYIPSLAEPQVTELLSYKDYYDTDELALNVGSLASFDKIGEHALHFRIRENAALRGFQRDLVDLCKDCGLSISPFNDPAGWKPHITMGYSPRAVPFTSFASGLKVKPNEVHVSLSRDGKRELVYRGQVGRVIEAQQPVRAEDATIASAVWNVPEGTAIVAGEAQTVTVDPFIAELNQYEKFTINRWGQPLRAFEFRVMTEPLVSELTGQVKICTTKMQVKRLFEGLREALRKTGDVRWSEADHPRDPSGQFGEGGGSGGGDSGEDKPSTDKPDATPAPAPKPKPDNRPEENKPAKKPGDPNLPRSSVQDYQPVNKRTAELAQEWQKKGVNIPKNTRDASGMGEIPSELAGRSKPKLSITDNTPDGKGFITTSTIGDSKSDFYMSRQLHYDDNGNLIRVHNANFFLPNKYQGKGEGTRIFANQVESIRKQAGDTYPKITTLAGKGDRMNGYYTWARLGYDGDINDSALPDIPRQVKPSGNGGRYRVSDFMKSKEGRNYWRDNGYQMEMEFDTDPNSRSSKILDSYLAEKSSQ